ncbi:MAG: hypothetical protein A07HB70_02286 [uncultured archaeon A07HB70]|nr:MAG: hypothetical protein A07HB70_02286 [uncultured archaeon A07HB70]
MCLVEVGAVDRRLRPAETLERRERVCSHAGRQVHRLDEGDHLGVAAVRPGVFQHPAVASDRHPCRGDAGAVDRLDAVVDAEGLLDRVENVAVGPDPEERAEDHVARRARPPVEGDGVHARPAGGRE